MCPNKNKTKSKRPKSKSVIEDTTLNTKDLLPVVQVDGAKFIGLPNLGNSCFMNTVLHILSQMNRSTTISHGNKDVYKCIKAIEHLNLTRGLLKKVFDDLPSYLSGYVAGKEFDCSELLIVLLGLGPNESNIFFTSKNNALSYYEKPINKVEYRPYLTYKYYDTICKHQKQVVVQTSPMIYVNIPRLIQLEFVVRLYTSFSIEIKLNVSIPRSYTMRKMLKAFGKEHDTNKGSLIASGNNYKRFVMLIKEKDSHEVKVIEYKDFASFTAISFFKDSDTEICLVQLSSEDVYDKPRKSLQTICFEYNTVRGKQVDYIHANTENLDDVRKAIEDKIDLAYDIESKKRPAIKVTQIGVVDNIKIFSTDFNLDIELTFTDLKIEVSNRLTGYNITQKITHENGGVSSPCKNKMCAAQKNMSCTYISPHILVCFNRFYYEAKSLHFIDAYTELPYLIYDKYHLKTFAVYIKDSEIAHIYIYTRKQEKWYELNDTKVKFIETKMVEHYFRRAVLALYQVQQ